MNALVVKLGGSLWRSPQLAQWIAALRHYPGPITLVPGGGPFADAVRAAQPQMGFSNAAAHRMALLAMEQYGLALADRFEGLAPASTPQDAAAIHARHELALWTPTEMTLAAGVPALWEITSDSLAAFYAKAAGVRRLLLIKSVDLRDRPPAIVDAGFSAFADELEVFVAGPSALADAAERFERGGVAGVRVKSNDPDMRLGA